MASQIFVETWKDYKSSQTPCGSKILMKSFHVTLILRSKHFCVLKFLWKIRKFKMAAISGGTKNFWKLGQLLGSYPMSEKFCRNCSIMHGFQDTSIFCDFCEKFKNSKWPPFLVGLNIFENWVSYSAVTLWVKNFVEIALSCMAFKIQAFFAIFAKNSKWPPFLVGLNIFENWVTA